MQAAARSAGSAMSGEGEPGLKYGIDRMVARGRRIFGWGWVAHPTRTIDALTLVLAGDGWESRLPVNYGLVRADVKAAFPQLPDAESSGFVATGYIPRSPVARWTLEVEYGDGGKAQLDIGSAADGGPARRRLREIGYVLGAVARRLRRGDLRGILQRAKAQNYLAPSLDDAAIGRELRQRLAGATRVTMLFDHNMGGGANVYRRSIVDERLAAGADGAAVHLQPADPRLPSAAVPRFRCRKRGRRRDLPHLLVPVARDHRRARRRRRAVPEQPRLVRRAAGLRRVARDAARGQSPAAADDRDQRLFPGVPVVRAAQRRRALLRHSGSLRVRRLSRAASRELGAAVAAHRDRPLARDLGALPGRRRRAPLLLAVDARAAAARLPDAGHRAHRRGPASRRLSRPRDCPGPTLPRRSPSASSARSASRKAQGS